MTRLMVATVCAGALVAVGVPADAVPAFQVGVTHTQYSADSWRDPQATARARSVLGASTRLQAQALMGWGAMNPEPVPGLHDWSSLDQRMSLIGATKGTPVLTLCCSPDWMKGGLPGTTDWREIEKAPRPEHYADFARLAVEAVKRYPQVRHVLVWNELKGFYDSARNDWDIEAYTDLYNTVYDALKAHDPTLRVGGPYVPVDIWASAATMSHPSSLRGPWGVVDNRALRALEHWLTHKHGADMVVVDGGTWTKDKGLVTDEAKATDYFGAVTRWLRQRTSLPVWWSEFTVARAPGSTPTKGLAAVDRALATLKTSGASVAMQWHEEGADTRCVTCLWTDTSKTGGGREAPYAAVLRRYNRLG